MESERFDVLSRILGNGVSRRGALGMLTATLGLGLSEAEAKKKKRCKDCCTPEGESCNKESSKCKPKNCLNTPFTVEAHWTNPDTDHDTYIFVPNAQGASLPSPFIDYSCNPDGSDCQLNLYPFICVSKDATGPGDEVSTVRKLIDGKYQYWIEVYDPSPAKDLTVTLRRGNGAKVRSWTSPANPSEDDQIAWHVFDIDGKTGSVTSIDQVINSELPEVREPNTDVCPGV